MSNQLFTSFNFIKEQCKDHMSRTLLYITTIIPTILSCVYFLFIASDIYVSESSFIVRTPQMNNGASGLSLIMSAPGFSRSQDDNYSLNAYLRSRDALNQLEKNLPLKNYYGDKGDIFSHFSPWFTSNNNERFYQYMSEQMEVSLDTTSGITSLRVKAFDANEAKNINQLLLKLGEQFVNKLNQRAQSDSIGFAEEAVKAAEQHVMKAASDLRQYRVKNGIFDVEAQTDAQLSLVSQLQNKLSDIQVQIAQIRAFSPKNPQLQALLAQEKSINDEILNQHKKVLGEGNDSIVNKSAEYHRLQLTNELAIQELTVAISTLHNIKSQMLQQHLYLEVIDSPSLPDFAEYPRRLYNIISTFFIGLILFGILSLVIASIKEHKN